MLDSANWEVYIKLASSEYQNASLHLWESQYYLGCHRVEKLGGLIVVEYMCYPLGAVCVGYMMKAVR